MDNLSRIDKLYAARLKRLRHAAGLTQQQMAQCCGTSVSLIQKLESGERRFLALGVDVALKIANTLGISINDLLEIGTTDETPDTKNTTGGNRQ